MNKKIYFIEILVAHAFVFIALSGCASSRTNLVKKEMISIERSPSKGNVHIFRVSVDQEGDELVVSGRVTRRIKYRLPSQGHIDIAVFSPKDEVIGKASTSYIPRIIRREGQHRASYFTARFSVIPPKGSTVRLSYHTQRNSAAKTIFDCGDNAAVNPG
jgi:hypothetical protein